MIIHTDDRPISYTMVSSSPDERVEPITLAWSKLHLRFPTTAEDTLLVTYLAAARMHFEEQTGRQSVDAIWEYALDAVPDQAFIELPRPPLASVVAVLYDDAAGVEQTFDAAKYRVLPSFVPPAPDVDPVIDPYCPCGGIELVAGAAWPTTNGLSRSLRIRRICGYGATFEAMPPLLVATLGTLAQYFHDRESDALPLGVEMLIRAFKWTALPTRPPRTTTAVLAGARFSS